SSADEHELRNLLLDGSGPLLPRFTRILPPGVSALVARMIRRSPAKRPSAAQVRSEIEAFVPRVPSGAPGAGASKAPTRVPAAAEPVAKAEERGPALADPPAAPTTASPDAGAAQESSVRATDADAAAGDTDARQRDGVPVPEADEPSGKLGAATLGPPPNVAPRIVGYRPRSRDPLSVMEGAPVDFSVRATDQDLNDPVTYAWFLDGRR